MRKRIISLILIAVLLLGVCAVAYGIERYIVPDMTFGGDTIELSLEEAIEIMKTEGSRAETAELNKLSDDAIAKGYAESAKSISDLLEKLSYIGGIEASSYAEQLGATDVNERIVKLRRDFAREQLDANHQAELNQIEAITIESYYGVLQAEENLRVAKENLANQQAIYKNTMKKYEKGTVAKFDTLFAETELKNAENNVAYAETILKTAKMNFNMLLGFDLMQDVKLTDDLVALDLPEGTLTEFIEAALDNRNEIKATLFARDIQEILLNNLKYRYPTNSSTYLKQQVAFETSKKTANDAPLQIEMEIRIKYMDLQDKKRAVEAAKVALANAEEGFRLASITYDAGMNTITDVQDAQIRCYQAGQAVAKAITDYDLAIYAFKHAIGVGTTRIPL